METNSLELSQIHKSKYIFKKTTTGVKMSGCLKTEPKHSGFLYPNIKIVIYIYIF